MMQSQDEKYGDVSATEVFIDCDVFVIGADKWCCKWFWVFHTCACVSG